MINTDSIYIQEIKFYPSDKKESSIKIKCEFCGAIFDSDNERHICKTIQIDEDSICKIYI